jgi:hypothetical protein
MYIDEGYEDMLKAKTQEQLRFMVNRTTNAVRNGERHPSYWSQSDVRKQGQRLQGAYDLACEVIGRNGREIDSDLKTDVLQAIRNAIAFTRRAA